jgi:hypothetical protein
MGYIKMNKLNKVEFLYNKKNIIYLYDLKIENYLLEIIKLQFFQILIDIMLIKKIFYI